MTENGSVALKMPSLSVRNRAPCSRSVPGLVVISIRPPPELSRSYSGAMGSGFTRIEAMELFGGIALPF